MLRDLEVLTNPGGSRISAIVDINGTVGDQYQIFVSDSDGNFSFDPGDTYFINGGGTLGLGHVLSDGNGVTLNSTTQGADVLPMAISGQIGPGQTVRILRFEIQQPDTGSAESSASQPASGRLRRRLDDLSDAVKGSIVNFDTGFDSIDPYVTSDLTQTQFTDNGPIGTLFVYFSESLDEATAGNADNYSLVGAGTDGQFGTARRRLLRPDTVLQRLRQLVARLPPNLRPGHG